MILEDEETGSITQYGFRLKTLRKSFILWLHTVKMGSFGRPRTFKTPLRIISSYSTQRQTFLGNIQ